MKKRLFLGFALGLFGLVMATPSVCFATQVKAAESPSSLYSEAQQESNLNNATNWQTDYVKDGILSATTPAEQTSTEKSNVSVSIKENSKITITTDSDAADVQEYIDNKDSHTSNAEVSGTVSESSSSSNIITWAAQALGEFQKEINLIANIIAGVLMSVCVITFACNCVKLSAYSKNPIMKHETWSDIIMNLITAAGIGGSRFIAYLFVAIALG